MKSGEEVTVTIQPQKRCKYEGTKESAKKDGKKTTVKEDRDSQHTKETVQAYNRR